MLLAFMRYGLPALMFVAGFVVLFAGDDSIALEGWGMLVGASIALLTLNLLFRIGFRGDSERAEEEDARAFLTKHGHWPDEPPPKR